MIWQLLLAGALGGVVGATELGARYRDDPAAVLRTPPGLLYLAVNAAAAMAALVLVEAFGWRFGLGPDASALQVRVVQVLVAGIGSAALFRSSLFTVRQGDQEIGIGPSALLTGLLSLVDRSVDRRRALERLGRDDLAGLSFDRDHVALTELCTGALQNLDRAEAHALGELAARLKDQPDLSDPDKLDCFALQLLTLVGPKAMQAAAQRLRERHATESPEPDEAATTATAVPPDQAEAWRARLAVVNPVAERPISASVSLEAALEAAWLHERLEEYDEATDLYEELMAAVGDMSLLFTWHELSMAWSRTQLSRVFQEGKAYLEKNPNASEYFLPPHIKKARKDAHARLVRLCSSPGGQPGTYAAALYMLAEPGESTSDRTLGYLSDALDLLSGRRGAGRRGLICMLHFARARCYLARGDAQAAAEDLVLASESEDRDLRTISGSLGGLLKHRLPWDQELAVWRVIEPLGFDASPEVEGHELFGVNPYEDDDEGLETQLVNWYRKVADTLTQYIPRLVPEAPLRTLDLLRSDEAALPRSFLPEPESADGKLAAEEV